MRAVHRFKTALDAFLRWFCISLFALMIALVTWQVVARWTVGGNVWTEVTARIAFIWQGLVGAAYVIGEKEDVAMDFLVKRFPPVVVKAIEIFAFLVVGVFAVWVMIYGGLQYIESTWADTVQLLPVTQGQVYLVLPITGALIVVYCVLHIIEIIAKPVVRPTGDVEVDGLMEEGI
ncbi:TRAP transporter small permease [Cellulomonas aerilata]|uniref:C4-dicarboxylate ABC transporter permease n=1 Tax=Cellulomonas aerilata TaxID=515326 RepID=A0A512DF78_9CELL|nr:TRAP transporter small permease [Cellulomonas aerilata]GEO35101.1 C4-dicarboxylate ABC transporter permease [Cellulomonas aerilata]